MLVQALEFVNSHAVSYDRFQSVNRTRFILFPITVIHHGKNNFGTVSVLLLPVRGRQVPWPNRATIRRPVTRNVFHDAVG